MLLMVEKGIKGGLCHCNYRYAKEINKYMKDYEKNKESSSLPVNNFEQIKNTSQFNEDFIKNYNEKN